MHARGLNARGLNAKNATARPQRTPLGAVSGNVRRGAATGLPSATAGIKKKTKKMVKKKTRTKSKAVANSACAASASGSGLFQSVSSDLISRPLKLKRGNEGKKVSTSTIKAVNTKRKIVYSGDCKTSGTPKAPQAPSAQPHQPQEPVTVKSDSNTTSIVESSPSSSVEDPMVCAKRLILEAKAMSKSSDQANWLTAVNLYAEARDLLPRRLGDKLDRKIHHLRERIAAATSPSQLEDSIKRAKTLIVQAKALSKSGEHAAWTRAIGLYGEARDLLPPHLGNKLTRKIGILQTRVSAKIDELKRKKIATPVPDPLDDLLSDDLGDFFAEFRPAEKIEAKTPAMSKSKADWLSDEEEENENADNNGGLAPSAIKAPPSASPLVFDRFGSVAAEVFALALGGCSTDLNSETPLADELLDVLRAVDSCESQILASNDHALKTNWRHLAKRKKRRVHFCTFDLTTGSPPEKWQDVRSNDSGIGSKNTIGAPSDENSVTQEALAYELGGLLSAARTFRARACVDNMSTWALKAFLEGLTDVSTDLTLSSILRKAATFFRTELACLLEPGDELPFASQFRSSIMSAIRFHMRCLFNTKPDSITTRTCTEMDSDFGTDKEDDIGGQSGGVVRSNGNVDLEKRQLVDKDATLTLNLDSEGSIKFCGNDDIAAIVHQALRDRFNVSINADAQKEVDFSDIDDRWLHLEASRFLYEVLRHPAVEASIHGQGAGLIWKHLSRLGLMLGDFPEVCPAEQCVVVFATQPESLVDTLKSELERVQGSSQHPRAALAHVDACLYSKAMANQFATKEATNKSTRQRSKRKCKKPRTKSNAVPPAILKCATSKYILRTSLRRFQYPTLNHRGDAPLVYGEASSAASGKLIAPACGICSNGNVDEAMASCVTCNNQLHLDCLKNVVGPGIFEMCKDACLVAYHCAECTRGALASLREDTMDTVDFEPEICE